MRYLDAEEVKRRYGLLLEKGADDESPGFVDLGAFFERMITRVYNALLRDGHVAIDCGANAGHHTIPMANLVRPTGRVYAVEALPEVVARLKTQIDTDKVGSIVKVVEAAVSDQTGTDSFLRVLDDVGYSGLKPRDYPETFSRGLEAIQIEKVRIDDFCTEPHRVSFMKLDLEGGEFRALRGGVGVMSQGRPVVAFESARDRSAHYYEYTMGEFFDFFAALNYDLYDVLGTHFSPDLWIWDEVPFSWYLIGIPKEEKNTLEKISASIDRGVNSEIPGIFSM